MTTQADDGWYSDEAATFGDRVAAAREAVGLTQSELARNLGVKVKTVRGWENDVSEPRANKLQMLSGVLGVSLMWLLNGEGDGVPSPEDADEGDRDVALLLVELRGLRTEIEHSASRLGRLEKALRTKLKAGDAS